MLLLLVSGFCNAVEGRFCYAALVRYVRNFWARRERKVWCEATAQPHGAILVHGTEAVETAATDLIDGVEFLDCVPRAFAAGVCLRA